MKELYPFKENFFRLPTGHSMHYLDEGRGQPVLMLHGNPTWSFFYRNIVKAFSGTNRLIVPDHLGCGFSDKPQNYEYTLEHHIDNLEKLVGNLGLKDFSLVVHDWGGAIGFGLLERHPELASRIVILNTAAFTSEVIATRIDICRMPLLNDFLIRRLNGFAWPATRMAVVRKLSPEVRRGFLFPYGDYEKRVAIAGFVADIPMTPDHRSYATLKKIELSLPKHRCPRLILWGKRDFCFNDYFLGRWREIYPDARVRTFRSAGHYLLEDAGDEIIGELKRFF